MDAPFLVENLPLDSLELDKTNPRIRKWIEQYGDSPTFEQMLLALGAGSSDPDSGSTVTFHSLRESIRAQGSIINPIIVQRLAGGNYRVVEGNTRVAIYRSFRDDGVPGDWTHIPAIVHADISDFDIDAIRLQCHVVGPRPWDPYSKAKYLDHLLNVEGIPLEKIVSLCGGKRNEVLEYVDAYRDMENHYRPILESDGDFDPTRFSAFRELQKAGVKEALVEAKASLSDFAEWVRDRKIDPLNTVRAIPRILKNPVARAKFLSVGAREAMRVLDAPAPSALTGASLAHLLQAVLERLNLISYPQFKELKADIGGREAQLMFETQAALSEICSDLSAE